MEHDPGPSPALRAALGLLLGAALGAVVALLLPRRKAPHEARSADDPATA